MWNTECSHLSESQHSFCWAFEETVPNGNHGGLNTLRPRQMDAISQTTFSNAFSWMKMFEFRLKFHWSLFPWVQLTIFQSAMVQIMAWCRPGDKPLSEPMMVSLLTHICVTRPQWVNHTKPIAVVFTWSEISLWYRIVNHCPLFSYFYETHTMYIVHPRNMYLVPT